MIGTFTWKNDDAEAEFTESLDQRPRGYADEPDWDAHTPEQRAKALLSFYNSTLRPHEKARRFVKVHVETPSGAELSDPDPEDDTLSILEQGMMPDLDFFEPNDRFTEWLNTCIHLRYHPILDLGAGNGLMTKTMQDAGFLATGIDIMRRPNPHTLVQVIPADLIVRMIKDMPHASSIFIARPCHSGFAQNYFKLHLKFCNRLFAYYIGLPKNVEMDLPDMSYDVVAEDVGSSGENVYQVYGTKTDCKNLYTLTTRAGVYEWDDETSEYVSTRESGMMPAGMRVDGKTHEVRNFYAGVRYTYQHPPRLEDFASDQECGWIDPDGRVYKVAYTRHSEFVYQGLFMDEIKDMHGWVKIWPPGSNDHDIRWYREGDDFEPTFKQCKVMLSEFGIDHQRGIMREAILPSRKDKY